MLNCFVKDYGALGDGVTMDTKALQAAYFKAIKGQDPRYGHWLTNYKF